MIKSNILYILDPMSLIVSSFCIQIMDYSDANAKSIQWYHGKLSHRDAERRLMEKGEPGYYLLRMSPETETKREFILSFITTSKEVRHLHIPAQRRHILLGKNPNLTTLKEVTKFIVEKFKSDDLCLLLFQLNCNEESFQKTEINSIMKIL